MCIFCLNEGPHFPLGPFDGALPQRGTSDGPGRGALSHRVIEEDGDAPAALTTDQSFEPEETFSGTISDAADTDYVRVWLEEGATYVLDLEGDADGPGTELDDPTLRLRAVDGTELAFNDDGGAGLNAQITHIAGYTGWHILQADGFSTATGDYTLTATQQSYNAFHEDLGDAPDDSSTDYFLAVDTSTDRNFWDGAIDFRGDLDWIEIYLEAGKIYRFSAEGWGDTPARDLELWLYDSDENELAYDDDDYRDDNPQFVFQAEETGTYYLSVAHAQDRATGDYFVEYYERGFDLDDPRDDEASDAPETSATPYSILVDDIFVGAIDTIGDVDWLAVDLQAGNTYILRAEEDWYFYDRLNDPELELYDAAGTLLASDRDDGPGLDAALRFTPDSTATYYMAISSEAEGGTGVGYYEAKVSLENAKTDPLEAINWGTGTLPTDENPVQVYFAPSQWYVTPDGEQHLRLSDYTEAEKDFFMSTLDMISLFTPLTFARTEDPLASDMLVAKSDLKGASGFANPPGTGWLPESAIVMDDWEGYWTEEMMQSGSFTHGTILHEAGHALGLAHPHDGGGSSEIMRGVLSSSDTGDGTGFNLNQFPFSIMSYNDIWQGLTTTPSFNDGIGGLGTFGALDMAALQALYGDTQRSIGNSNYKLHENDWFETIWDTGGTDTIIAAGTANAVIDLRAATLDYSNTGGGTVSYQEGAFGGFTIAHGVEIERGFGGRGHDTITGNDLDNHLKGRSGRDTLSGLDGDDVIEGDGGDDTIFGGSGADRLIGNRGGDIMWGGGDADLLFGHNGYDEMMGGLGSDRLDAGRGRDTLIGGLGDDWLLGGGDRDTFVFADGDGTDTIHRFQAFDRIDLADFGPTLSFGDLTITTPTADSATLTIAGSSNQILFTELQTALEEKHFLFDVPLV